MHSMSGTSRRSMTPRSVGVATPHHHRRTGTGHSGISHRHTHYHPQSSAQSAASAVVAANSVARKAPMTSRSHDMEMYNDIVASVFEQNVEEMEKILRSVAKVGDIAKMSVLLEKRTDVLFSIDAKDHDTGYTAVMLAAQHGHSRVVQLLCKHGADVTITNREGQTAFELAMSPPIRHILLESVDKGGPHHNLCQAAWQGNVYVLRKILAQSTIDINCRNVDGLTPLLLVTRDASLFDQLSNRLSLTYSPLDVVSELLSHTSNVSAIDCEKRTALHYISSSRAAFASKLVESLIKAGAEIDVRDKSQRTPLHCAALVGNTDIVIALLDCGADPVARDDAGMTPLHLGAQAGHEHVTSVLLRRGADITLVNDGGQTALDVTRSRRLQQVLHQAWKEATLPSAPPTQTTDTGEAVNQPAADEIVEADCSKSPRCGKETLKTSCKVSKCLERSKSLEQPDTNNSTVHCSSDSPRTAAGTQTPPIAVSTGSEETSPRLAMSGTTYSRHMSSASQSGPRSSSIEGQEVATTSQTRLNRKGMARTPTRRSPVGRRRLSMATVSPAQIPTKTDEQELTAAQAALCSHNKDVVCSSCAAVNIQQLIKFGDGTILSTLTGVQTADLVTTQSEEIGPPLLTLSDRAMASFKSILRSGEFNIEESRVRKLEDCSTDPVDDQVRKSDDSGLVEDCALADDTANVSSTSSKSSVLSNLADSCTTSPETTGVADGSRQSSKQINIKSALSSSESHENIAGSHLQQDAKAGVNTSQTSQAQPVPQMSAPMPLLIKPELTKGVVMIVKSTSQQAAATKPNKSTNAEKDGKEIESAVRETEVETSARKNAGNVQQSAGLIVKPLHKTETGAVVISSKTQSSEDKSVTETVQNVDAINPMVAPEPTVALATVAVTSTKAQYSEDTSVAKSTDATKQQTIAAKSVAATRNATMVSTKEQYSKDSSDSKSHLTSDGTQSNAASDAAVINDADKNLASASQIAKSVASIAPVKPSPINVQNASNIATTSQVIRRTESSPSNLSTIPEPTLSVAETPVSHAAEPAHRSVATVLRPMAVSCINIASPSLRSPVISAAAKTTIVRPMVPPKTPTAMSVTPAVKPTNSTAGILASLHIGKLLGERRNHAVTPIEVSSSFDSGSNERYKLSSDHSGSHSITVRKPGLPDSERTFRSNTDDSLTERCLTSLNSPTTPTAPSRASNRKIQPSPSLKSSSNADENTSKNSSPRDDLMNPVTSSMLGDQSGRKITVGMTAAPVMRVMPRQKSTEEHSGPVICDIFESLRRRQQEEIAAAAAAVHRDAAKTPASLSTTPCFGKSQPQRPTKSARPKTGTSVASVATVKSKSSSRQPSANSRKKTKTPTTTTTAAAATAISGDMVSVHVKPTKTGKERRKKKKDRLVEQNDCANVVLEASAGKPGVMLIGGIGWQIEAKCSSVVSEHAVRKFVDETSPNDSNIALSQSFDKSSMPRSSLSRMPSTEFHVTLPGQVFPEIPDYMEDVDDEDDDDPFSSLEKIEKEATVSEVTNIEDFIPDDTLQAMEQYSLVTIPSESSWRSLESKNPAVVTHIHDIGSLDTAGEVPSSPRTSPDAQKSKAEVSEVTESGDNRSTENEGCSSETSQVVEAENQQVSNDPELDAAIDEIMNSTSYLASLVSSTKLRRMSHESSHSNHHRKILSSSGLHAASSLDFMSYGRNHSNLSDKDVKPYQQSDATEVSKIPGEVTTATQPSGKPPVIPPRSSGISSAISDAVMTALNPQSSPPDRSPRFVRKHDSFVPPVAPSSASSVRSGHVRQRRSVEKMHGRNIGGYSMMTGNSSDVDVTLNNSLRAFDDSLVATDQVVTSRLGRSGLIHSRSGSAVSETCSVASDEVETIQWKRGNILGKGAYGTVWCGLTNAGELIAVKMIELNTGDMVKAEREYEQIQEEVELLKTLKHRNIVGYLGTSLEDNVVSIFMQFVPGGSIANVLARFGALEEEVFCNYTKQILEGVEYLHRNNVIHRDIKGGNIMLMPDGVIKLIDFGCAKKLCINLTTGGSPSLMLRSMRGTPYWMAPEVVSEQGHGTKSDIWSIGCTVFEMATKKPPWADMPPTAAIFCIGCETKSIPQLPDKFTTSACNFVSLCLTRDPTDRPSATQLLTHHFIVSRRKTAKTSRLS